MEDHAQLFVKCKADLDTRPIWNLRDDLRHAGLMFESQTVHSLRTNRNDMPADLQIVLGQRVMHPPKNIPVMKAAIEAAKEGEMVVPQCG